MTVSSFQLQTLGRGRHDDESLYGRLSHGDSENCVTSSSITFAMIGIV